MPLTAQQLDTLSRMLGNETDMCFRRRAFTVFEYLDLADSDVLLDCGCGRGFFLNMTKALSGCTAVGIDFEPEVLATARTELARKQRPASLCCAGVYPLPFCDEAFDKILFSEVLEHTQDHDQALAELFRVLKPGGVLALTVPNDRYPLLWDPINRVLQSVFNRPIRTGVLSGIWANHERLYKIETLRELVAGHGFKIESEDLLVYYCFPFAHNLVYGVGKELLLAGWLPGSLSKAADRFTYDANPGSGLNPINLLRSVFLKIDRLNDLRPPRRSSVIIAMKLRKPGGGQLRSA